MLTILKEICWMNERYAHMQLFLFSCDVYVNSYVGKVKMQMNHSKTFK